MHYDPSKVRQRRQNGALYYNYIRVHFILVYTGINA